MTPGIGEGPSPPPERASWRTCLCDLQLCSSECERNRGSGGTCYSGLIDLVCSVGLPVLIHYALRPPPPTAPGDAGPLTPVGSGTRRAGQARITPPLGLVDIFCSSPLPAAAAVARPLWLTRAAADNADDHEQQPLSTAGSISRARLLTSRPLVEIFAVSANFPFVGSIDIADSRWGKNIYWREDWGGEYKKFFFRKKKWLSSDSGHSSLFEFEDKLVLTGPSRYISAYGGFIVQLYIPATKKKDREIHKLCWNAEEDMSLYDKPQTRTIVTKRGCVYVTCAVVSDAVEAYVKVMLRLPCEAAVCAKVHGHINARMDTFNIGSTLFSKDVDEAVDVSISRDSLPQGQSDLEFCHPIILPLDRSLLVVPLGACLQVKGELVFNGSNVVSVNHSVLIDGYTVESHGVQDNYCYTTVAMLIRPAC